MPSAFPASSDIAPALSHYIKKSEVETGFSYLATFESAYHQDRCPTMPGGEVRPSSSDGMIWTEVSRSTSLVQQSGRLTPYNFAAPILLLLFCCAMSFVRSVWDERREAKKLVATAYAKSSEAVGQASDAIGSAVPGSLSDAVGQASGAIGSAVPDQLNTSVSEAGVKAGKGFREATKKLGRQMSVGKLHLRPRQCANPTSVGVTSVASVAEDEVDVKGAIALTTEVDEGRSAGAEKHFSRPAAEEPRTSTTSACSLVSAGGPAGGASGVAASGSPDSCLGALTRKKNSDAAKMNHGLMLRKIVQDVEEMKHMLGARS